MKFWQIGLLATTLFAFGGCTPGFFNTTGYRPEYPDYYHQAPAGSGTHGWVQINRHGVSHQSYSYSYGGHDRPGMSHPNNHNRRRK